MYGDELDSKYSSHIAKETDDTEIRNIIKISEKTKLNFFQNYPTFQ